LARDFGGAQQSESEPGRQDSFRNADRPQSILRLNGACGLKMRGDMRLEPPLIPALSGMQLFVAPTFRDNFQEITMLSAFCFAATTRSPEILLPAADRSAHSWHQMVAFDPRNEAHFVR
ncbi:hypothetical protein AiwAL_20080, partial [Acidiphilium sp. AL]|uniref:hypothetical protein n=1 Tax=Acidiphilium sp. AL TaxID=2871704 RepID=UPI0021CB640E